MSIVELSCPTCGRTLRVGQQHAGKQIRCPACQQISIAPGKARNEGEELAVANEIAGGNATSWHVRMPEGPIYGPVAWGEVQSWAAEGRLVADCELAEAASGPWRRADELLPFLATKTAQPEPQIAPNSYPWSPATNGSQNLGYVAPHRGGLVLVLGLLGFAGTCPIFSFLAWVMGSHDLREMRAGRMDRSGESTTVAGMIFGMIVSILWIIAGVVLSIVALIVLITQF
jgi:hypothetical protein